MAPSLRLQSLLEPEAPPKNIPERHDDFTSFMREMHREFHRLRARGDDAPEFVNDTTRELDARMDEARSTALRGDWERAVTVLDEAKEYGRPRAATARTCHHHARSSTASGSLTGPTHHSARSRPAISS